MSGQLGDEISCLSFPLRSIQRIFSIEKKVVYMRGTLTRFDRYSEIGMITSELGIEALVHKSSIEPSRWPLKQGQAVEFRIFYGPFGPLAEDVRGVRL